TSPRRADRAPGRCRAGGGPPSFTPARTAGGSSSLLDLSAVLEPQFVVGCLLSPPLGGAPGAPVPLRTQIPFFLSRLVACAIRAQTEVLRRQLLGCGGELRQEVAPLVADRPLGQFGPGGVPELLPVGRRPACSWEHAYWRPRGFEYPGHRGRALAVDV